MSTVSNKRGIVPKLIASKEQILQSYPDVFDGIGCFPGPPYNIQVWINSFVLVERKDKLGKLKLRICLDPTNLNKAIVCEPYHFKTPEDIAHLLAEMCYNSV